MDINSDSDPRDKLSVPGPRVCMSTYFGSKGVRFGKEAGDPATRTFRVCCLQVSVNNPEASTRLHGLKCWKPKEKFALE